MKLILKYFPDLSDHQYLQMKNLEDLYSTWNQKINVISRKDIEHLYLHHVLHSLSIFKWMPFKANTRILDLGCGGGFPGIPLAIMMPDVRFHLVDARKKKITVVNAIAEALELSNVKGTHGRVEDVGGRYHFVVSRAVAPMRQLWDWSHPLISHEHNHSRKNGIIALKGGHLMKEMEGLPKGADFQLRRISSLIDEPYFTEKSIAYAYSTNE